LALGASSLSFTPRMRLNGKKSSEIQILQEISDMIHGTGSRPYPIPITEVAKMLGVTRGNIYHLILSSKIMCGDFREVKCPDGSIRLVLKNLEKLPKIFGQFVPEWQFKLNGVLKATQDTIAANAGTEIGKKATKLYDEVDQLNSRSISLFTMGYMQFTTNPCSNDKKLNETISKINKMINRLSEIQMEVESMNQQPLEEEETKIKKMDVLESKVISMDSQFDSEIFSF